MTLRQKILVNPFFRFWHSDDLLVWFVWVDCSAAVAASSPAPKWKCTPLSVAGWQPGGQEKKDKITSTLRSSAPRSYVWLVAWLEPLSATHLTELLSIAVWDECFKWLESRVDALHTPTLVAVGDLSADSPLLVPRCLWGQRNVGQTKGTTGGGPWLV